MNRLTLLVSFSLLVACADTGSPALDAGNDGAVADDGGFVPDAIASDAALALNDGSNPDVRVPAPDARPPSGDTSSSDTATPSPDTAPGAFCGGTPVAGTCLADFFATADACFRPSGACTMAAGSNQTRACWASGARYRQTGSGQTAGFNYFSGNQQCFYGSWTPTNGDQRSYTFTANGIDLLVYNSTTGATTCLNGTMVTLAPAFGGCRAMLDVIEIDTSGCAAGVCN